MAHNTVDEFTDCLKKDFGSVMDMSDMSVTALIMGPHGLDGFLSRILDPLLDTLPITHSSYNDLYKLLSTICKELAKKISNHKKVSSSPSYCYNQYYIIIPESQKEEGRCKNGCQQ